MVLQMIAFFLCRKERKKEGSDPEPDGVPGRRWRRVPRPRLRGHHHRGGQLDLGRRNGRGRGRGLQGIPPAAGPILIYADSDSLYPAFGSRFSWIRSIKESSTGFEDSASRHCWSWIQATGMLNPGLGFAESWIQQDCFFFREKGR